jgi:hypothetical protein
MGTEETEEATGKEEVLGSEEMPMESRRELLQAKLKENMKREDELNRLMQLKIAECHSVVPKQLEQIL